MEQGHQGSRACQAAVSALPPGDRAAALAAAPYIDASGQLYQTAPGLSHGTRRKYAASKSFSSWAR
jgi:hypothetical protein